MQWVDKLVYARCAHAPESTSSGHCPRLMVMRAVASAAGGVGCVAKSQEVAIESALPNLLPVQAIERCHCILAVQKADTGCGHTIRSVASCSMNGVATAPVANSGATTSQDRRRQDCWPLKSTSVRQPRASAVATGLREKRKLDRDYYINGSDRDKVLRLQQSPRDRVFQGLRRCRC